MDNMLKHSIRSEIVEYMKEHKKEEGGDGVEKSIAGSSTSSPMSSTRKDQRTEG